MTDKKEVLSRLLSIGTELENKRKALEDLTGGEVLMLDTVFEQITTTGLAILDITKGIPEEDEFLYLFYTYILDIGEIKDKEETINRMLQL